MLDQRLTSTDASKKYALKVTLANGTSYVFTRIGNNLALLPLNGNNVEGKFLAWDTPAQVKDFLKEIKDKYPEEFEKIWKMKPDIFPVDPIQ